PEARNHSCRGLLQRAYREHTDPEIIVINPMLDSTRVEARSTRWCKNYSQNSETRQIRTEGSVPMQNNRHNLERIFARAAVGACPEPSRTGPPKCQSGSDMPVRLGLRAKRCVVLSFRCAS